MYPSVKDEIKRNFKKGTAPKRATNNTLRKLGGIDAVPYTSHVLAIGQAYEIRRTLKPENTDPLKKLIKNSKVMIAQVIQLFKKFKQANFLMILCCKYYKKYY